jgi:hypothetical protein
MFFICCSPLTFKPTQADVDFATTKWGVTTHEQMEKGYSLYVGKCGGCHYLHKPNEYSEKKWMEILPEMGKEAKVDQEQYDLILRYVITKSYAMASVKK